MKKLLFFMLGGLMSINAIQAQDDLNVIKDYLNAQRNALNLTQEDINDPVLKSSSFSKSMRVQVAYVNQSLEGIEVHNSTSRFAIKDQQVYSTRLGFVSDLGSKVNTTSPSISAENAVRKAAQSFGLTPASIEVLSAQGHDYLISAAELSQNDIPVSLVFQKVTDEQYRLAWDLSIYLLDSTHYYSVRIDAQNGSVLETHDWVLHCDFGHGNHQHNAAESVLFNAEATSMAPVGGASGYRVFPIPYSSPLDGSDEFVFDIDAVDPASSPFGWHDTDGVVGAEYTYTRGNNVYAQEDINGNNGTGASPEGGTGLTFDFPYNLPQDPANFTDAATVNLFYWNNLIHDFTYQYGFDEESGNFQENNYGNPGNGSDSVNADAQDGSGTNNANFATPPDGGNPRMQMFIWTTSSGPINLLTINNGPLAGVYPGVPANFGGALPIPPLTEDLVAVEDDNSGGTSTDPQDACDPITNGPSLDGKIVVIRRGECEFGFKALAAQNEGAVAVIMVNNVPGDPVIMAPGAVGAQVTIPLFMVTDVIGEPIMEELLAGNPVNGTIDGGAVPPATDGDLDNEIIAHEYAHGISNRLTGGPVNVNCLNNAEQMGEGWSDYLGLIMTMQAGDQRGDVRGLAAYASGNPNGIREAPYSTDFSINDYTYQDTNNNVSQPHGIGFVWATALWEMTWDLIDLYGFDSDLVYGSGGNNIAFQLVMDGMKLQDCGPGFIDGRDAIIEADELIYGGLHRCLIWEAFARRGVGFSASQGSPASRSDQVEAFDIPADCNLSTGDNNYDNNFSIYPNPNYGAINIHSKIDVGRAKISIMDINGRTVWSQTLELGNQTQIDAGLLSSGIYLVRIQGNNYSHTSKLIMR
ncbi:MAG: T9SS-dependent M36 family metallopeptidase [Flavobacteriaceae bacterium]